MSTERKLFGTDGVRGEVGTFLTPELATALGRAAATACEADRPQILIVRDTRESGPMLEAALASGIAAAGGDAFLGGVLPTPAASILTRRHGFDLAAVVSASHNPYGDNGIKLFSAAGGKLDDATEAAVEALLHQEPPASSKEPGRVRELNGALEDYLRALEGHLALDLSGLRVMLDCANGSTYQAAPAIFERLGAAVEAIAGRVGASDAQIGFAFDGDGDRMLAVDGEGRVHDGDDLIALAARDLAGRGELRGGVAVTVMTNYGFHQAMEEAGIEVATTNVGDRYVLEELQRRDWQLGGEQSGHIISTDFAPTGDGIAAALLTLRALGGRPLSEVEPFVKLPQTLVNGRGAGREAIAGADAVWEAAEAENAALEGRGRVLVRPSGTEPLVRVMVEAPTGEEAAEVSDRLVALVERELG